ncbi:hypothetical protein HF521_021516 [Silurus meridionalis]|uniref:asparaginase n=1 Tax=Silurus meridionalis TaxID=175797 RepID=A0A8T0BBJ8_SILME|nr:hypothetical protein HF521_021516 [Silurus meridionalis]
MTSLARALSHTTLSQLDQSDAFQSQSSMYRMCASSRRRISASQGVDSMDVSLSAEARVLVINTGGTIGMMYHNDVLSPEPNALVKALRKLPILHDELYAQQTRLYEYYDSPENTLVLALSKQNKRIVYTVLEYSPLLDSCNMTTEDWATIAKDIEKYYEKYDGFVILHGTDTMAYTASALSFMCEHLGKPVILTGSQVPIYEMTNDGRDNLLGALLIAGQFFIPEVCLYFHHKLFRGNRVTKVDAGSFDAFISPNLAPLANAEVDIKINWDTVWRANTTAKFRVNTQMNRNVGLLRLFPGITADTVRAFLQPPMEGIVLETYGSGNAPDNRADLLDEFRKANERGVIMVNCTQCLRGAVTATYATGKALSDAGLVPGGDMTPEAALSKLSYILARKDLNTEEKKKDLEAIRDALTPTLACAAAKIGDVEALEAIKEMGGNLCMENYDGRTPLHIAACEGHLKVVQYLLSQGATVYAKDHFGNTPLLNAVRFRHKDVVKLLRKIGGHLSRDEMEGAGNKFCSLVVNADLEGLEIWHLAGADLTMPSYNGQRAIDVAMQMVNSSSFQLFRKQRRRALMMSGKEEEREKEEKQKKEEEEKDMSALLMRSPKRIAYTGEATRCRPAVPGELSAEFHQRARVTLPHPAAVRAKSHLQRIAIIRS